MGKLENKVAIISGAAGGIGYATAEKFLEEGASVMICDMAEDRLKAAAETLSQKGPVLWAALNICDEQAVNDMVKKTVETFGHVDILINNAGITKDAQFYKMDILQFQQVINVNLMGTVTMSKAVVPYMMEQKYGKIVSASSIACIKGNFGQSNYAASKAAIISFTRSLGRELGKYGINVNAIAPGFIRTAMTDAIPADIMKQKIDSIPLRRTGEVEDIAAAYAFLSSDEASFINATCLIVDGGMH